MAVPAGIVTPEGVLLEFEEAGVGSRIMAIALDLLIQGVGILLLLLVASVAALDSSFSGTAAVIFVIVAVTGFLLGYPIAMETATRGRTVGKMALGLRVVTVEGAPVRFRHAAIRAFLGLVDFYVPLLGGPVAIVAVLTTRRSQRLGDLVAGTIVVRERSAQTPASAFTFPPPQGYEDYVASLDISGLGDEHYALVRSFLLRVWDLAPNARAATSERLATAVATRLGHRPPPNVYPELFLACVAAAYQRRHEGAAASPRGAPTTGPPVPPTAPGPWTQSAAGRTPPDRPAPGAPPPGQEVPPRTRSEPPTPPGAP